ncbi:MAG: DNA gyrase subunit A [Euryarchaeota archaeon RBG_13_57_23]|nr:MAG: DNA gyrase subunit A [Euryarchaeota archaeon RBG_13_57_23]
MDDVTQEQQIAARLIQRPIETEMKKSYIDYAMSVIVSRALPDVSDGLKPVHRRILFAMNEMGLQHNKAQKKSARVVGEVLGKFHPHGDMAIYDTLVRMAQSFSMRYPLIDGQGNFGSVDGDSAAAMRYTECRLSKIAAEMLQDVDEDTVDFGPNFDGSLKEPLVLPAKLPNLLINGSQGIAVGMSTNVPPHNLNEVVDTVALMIDRQIDGKDTDLKDLIAVIKGPDFPTGGVIYGAQGIYEAYATGKGRIRVRARYTIEHDEDTGRATVIVTEIPYMVNKSTLLEEIADHVKAKSIEGVSDLRDESDKEGMRIVIELKRDAIEDVVLNQLFAHSQLQTTFGIINVALVANQPRVLTLKEMLEYYIEHRFDVVKRRTEYRLRQAEKRAHILAGLMIALDHLDEVIRIIRKAKTRDEAKNALMAKYLLSEEQTKAILEMQLQRLTGMEMQSVRDEAEATKKLIDELKSILKDEKKILTIIKKEALAVKEEFGDDRRTTIEANAVDMDIEDLIPVEDVVVMISNTGYIKRLPLDTYESQHRGGIGLMGMETKEEDYVVDLFVTCSHDYVMYITNKGRVYWLKAYKIPAGGRHAKGKPIVNLLEHLVEGEKVVNTIPVKLFMDENYLVFATQNGTIKKTKLSAYANIRQSGIIAIRLDEGDNVVDTAITDGSREIILATKKGLAARFLETDVRPTGRATYGVRGIRLGKEDEVVSMAIVSPKDQLLTVTENGYGKRSLVEDYRKIRRGGKGVITIKTGGRNGDVITAKLVEDDDELIITSVNGMVIRMPVQGISLLGRATMGVRLMKLRERDLITAVTRLIGATEEERAVEAGRTITSCPAPNGDIAEEKGEDEGDKESEEPEEEQDETEDGDK